MEFIISKTRESWWVSTCLICFLFVISIRPAIANYQVDNDDTLFIEFSCEEPDVDAAIGQGLSSYTYSELTGISIQPEHGKVYEHVMNGCVGLTYEPGGNYIGNDSFVISKNTHSYWTLDDYDEYYLNYSSHNSSETYNINVTGQLSISGTPTSSVYENRFYSFQPIIEDFNAESLNFTISNKPSWLTFNPSNGKIYGKPKSSDIGDYNSIVITASDIHSSVSLPPFSISVHENIAPIIMARPNTQAIVNKLYSYKPSVEDEEGDRLTFTGENIPIWASLSSTTGKIYGTPMMEHIGVYRDIVITVSDGNKSSSSSPFSVYVDFVAPPGDVNIANASKVKGNINHRFSFDGRYEVSWTNSPTSSVTHYELSEQTGGVWGEYADQGLSLSYEPIDKIKDTYKYRVRACKQTLCSRPVYSPFVVVFPDPIPDTPDHIRVSLLQSPQGSYEVNWPNTPRAEYYQISDKTNDGEWSNYKYVPISHTAKSYQNPPNQTYRHRIRACNLLGCSQPKYSKEIYVEVFTEEAPAPFKEDLPNLDSDSDQVGKISGKFRVNESGSATYSIPLDLPSGIAGTKPDLSIGYDSNGVNGHMGMGWSVNGISQISRCRSTLVTEGVNKYLKLNSEDRFCLDGQKLIEIDGGAYGKDGTQYKTELDSQVLVTSKVNSSTSDLYFEVQYPDGSTREFGNTTTSTLSSSHGVTLTWYVNEISDSFDNSVTYQYDQSNYGENEVVIDAIQYSGNTIDFQYDENVRGDREVSYLAGEKIELTTLLTDIVVSNHNGVAINSYHFNYDPVTDTRASRLLGIERCDGTQNGTCLPKTEFDWNSSTRIGASASSHSMSIGIADINFLGYQSLDYDGDSDMDLAFAYKVSTSAYKIKFYENNGDGTFDIYDQVFSNNAPVSNVSNLLQFSWKVFDYDGDGRSDLLLPAKNASGAYTYQVLSFVKGNLLFEEVIELTDTGLEYDEYLDTSQLLDVNGDGLADFVDRVTGETGKSLALLDRDTGFTDLVETSLGIGHLPSVSGDFNGDGRADFTKSHDFYAGTGYFDVLTFSDCDGALCLETLWTVDFNVIEQNMLYQDSKFADINGDGLTDWVYVSNKIYYRLSTGTGFTEERSSNWVTTNDVSNVALGDIDGNGKSDISFLEKIGSAVKRKVFELHGNEIVQRFESESGLSLDFDTTTTALVDLDNDGKLDFLNVDISKSKEVAWELSGVDTDEQRASVINTITDGFGNKVGVTYELLTNTDVYSKSNNAPDIEGLPVFDVTPVSQVVGSVTKDAPSYDVTGNSFDESASKTVQYSYAGLKVQAGGRGSLGFSQITSHDLSRDVETTTSYFQEFPYIGMPRSTHQYYDDGIDRFKISKATNTVDSVALENNGIYFPYIHVTTEESYVLNSELTSSTHTSTVVTEHTYSEEGDSYALLRGTTVTKTDELEGKVRTTSTTNLYEEENEVNWWIGRVTNTTAVHTYSDRESVTRESSFEYHDSFGVLEAEIVEPNDTGYSLYKRTKYVFDSFGNTTETYVCSKHFATTCGDDKNVELFNGEDGNALKVYRVASVAYDEHGRYPERAANGYFDIEVITNRDNLGLATTSQNANNVTTNSLYGVFGQSYYSISDTGAWSKVQRRWAAEATDLSAPAIPEGYLYVERVLSGGGVTVWKYIDRLGRTVAEAKQGFENDQIILKTYRFDKHNQLVKQGLASYQNPSLFVVSEYDVLGRTSQVSNPDGTVANYSYTARNNTVTTTSTYNGYSVNHSKTETLNGLGELVSVTDNMDNEFSYEYWVTGELWKAIGIDTENEVIETTYDSHGRKITMRDPDKGNWSYAYNALGELISQTNAKDQTTTNLYDALGRKRTRQDISPAGAILNETNWTYGWESGNAVNERGKLIGSSVDGVSKVNGYDDLGRLESTITEIDSSTYTERFTYDEYGRNFQYFDASGHYRGIRYKYQNGYLLSHQEAQIKDGEKYYYQVEAMDALGNVKQYRKDSTITYDYFNPVNGFLTERLVTGAGAVAILDQEYRFDGLGNLRKRVDRLINTEEQLALNGLLQNIHEQHFEYDGLNRVTHINDIEVVQYYANGNIKWKKGLDGNQFYCYNNSRPHAVTGRSTTEDCSSDEYTYDENGNMTVGKGNAITYSAFDKATFIDHNQGSSSFEYGANRGRYKRQDVDTEGVSQTTHFVGAVEIVKKSNSQVVNYRRNLNGAIHLVRSNDTSELHFVHGNHQGSLDTLTNAQGQIVKKFYYDLWGRQITLDKSQLSSSLSHLFPIDIGHILEVTTKGYTGHEHIAGSNIIHMNGRIYSEWLGRFLQADPMVQAPTNGQNFNRYSYVYNNPLSYTDPSGYYAYKPPKPTVFEQAVGIALIATGNVWAAAAWSGIIGYKYGGLNGAVIGAISTAAFGHMSSLNWWQTGAIHGAYAFAMGGKFEHGFISAGVGAYIGGGVDVISNDGARVFAAAMVGGTISDATGGNFESGAYSAAFSAAVKVSSNKLLSFNDSRDIFDPENSGESRELLGGKVQVVKHGGKNAVVTNEELKKISSELDTIFNEGGTNGSSIRDKIINGKFPARIILNSKGVQLAHGGSGWLTIDINAVNNLVFHDYATGSLRVASLTRILAHELTHATIGLHDSSLFGIFTGNLYPTVSYTDNLMKNINGTIRREYGNMQNVDAFSGG